jgi:hypothetical protein
VSSVDREAMDDRKVLRSATVEFTVYYGVRIYSNLGTCPAGEWRG